MNVMTLIPQILAAHDADLIIHIGAIADPLDTNIITLLKTSAPYRSPNLIFYLKTNGGDPDVAYRTARAIQAAYVNGNQNGNFILFVDGPCKSAGTLIAIGATVLIMSDAAELGPIDIQLRKADEVGERTSGLAPVQAFGTLQAEALSLFKGAFRGLRFDPELSFSTKIAAEVATNITVGLFNPIYAQLDPIRLAEIERSFKIAAEYGERIRKNLKHGSLGKLLAGYPSHGFVIDREEAKTLFEQVKEPTEDLKQLAADLNYLFGSEPLTGKSTPVFSAFFKNAPQEGQSNDAGSDEANCPNQGGAKAPGGPIDQHGEHAPAPDIPPAESESEDTGEPNKSTS